MILLRGIKGKEFARDIERGVVGCRDLLSSVLNPPVTGYSYSDFLEKNLITAVTQCVGRKPEEINEPDLLFSILIDYYLPYIYLTYFHILNPNSLRWLDSFLAEDTYFIALDVEIDELTQTAIGNGYFGTRMKYIDTIKNIDQEFAYSYTSAIICSIEHLFKNKLDSNEAVTIYNTLSFPLIHREIDSKFTDIENEFRIIAYDCPIFKRGRILPKPVDFSSTSESDKVNVGTADFSKGCYVSNYGKYNAEDVSPNKVFNLYHQNGQFYFPEYNQIDKAVKEPGVRYVIYRKDGGEQGSLKNVTLMVFIEFKNKDDAMGYFDKIMDSYFGKNPNDRFERNFINSESINKKLKGTVMGEWTLSDAMSAKTVRLTDLPESNYIRTQNEGRFDYYLNWNFLKWGDIANREPDNAQYIEAYSKRYQGVRAHHLSVKGKQLTLIQSFDLQKNSGEIEDFNRLCNALKTDNLSKLDMELNLRKYLLCISEIWDPYGTRIDKI